MLMLAGVFGAARGWFGLRCMCSKQGERGAITHPGFQARLLLKNRGHTEIVSDTHKLVPRSDIMAAVADGSYLHSNGERGNHLFEESQTDTCCSV